MGNIGGTQAVTVPDTVQSFPAVPRPALPPPAQSLLLWVYTHSPCVNRLCLNIVREICFYLDPLPVLPYATGKALRLLNLYTLTSSPPICLHEEFPYNDTPRCVLVTPAVVCVVWGD